MTAYCTVDDLLTGDIPLPTYISDQKVVDDAADEIDSIIGFVYSTPIVMVDIPEYRPSKLLLKRINSHLATGRLLMQIAASEEDTTLHAYGKSLVDSSLTTLNQLANRDFVLEGATMFSDAQATPTGPLQYNKDEVSNVDAFYDDIVFNEDPLWVQIDRLPHGGG